jgi:hypothetical protein
MPRRAPPPKRGAACPSRPITTMDITAPTTIPSQCRQLDAAHALLDRICTWPSVRVDVRGDDAEVHSGVCDTCIARLDLRTGALTAFVAADQASTIVEAEPLLRLTGDGVRLNVNSTGTRTTGERLMRWRIDLERFGPQLREASP